MDDYKKYRITPEGDRWRLDVDGGDRASGVFDNKKAAIGRGMKLAQKAQGQLFIHLKNGQIQEERTYRKDPYPPKG